MYVAGHVAASILAARYGDLDARLAVGAALFPDVVDKTCRYALGLVPTGRLPSHTFLALALTTAGAYFLGRRMGQAGRWAAAWFLGYSLHLVLDFAAQVPLLWPFVPYELRPVRLTYVLWHALTPIEMASLALEIALVGTALYVEVRRRRPFGSFISPRC
jgi:hypothetical protein